MAATENVFPKGNKYLYKYKDLEGNVLDSSGPFKASQMSNWDDRKLFDDNLTIFRISPTGETEQFELRKMRSMLKTAISSKSDREDNCFEVNESRQQVHNEEINSSIAQEVHDEPNCSSVVRKSVASSQLPQDAIKETSSSELEMKPVVVDVELVNQLNLGRRFFPTFTEPLNERIELPQVYVAHDSVFPLPTMSISELSRSSIQKSFDPDRFNSPPFMRLPDPGSDLIKPEHARAKVFTLYQLIVTVPTSLQNFAPYHNETVCCELCKINLTGASMFFHLINVQHLNKMSSCIFSETDVDFWIRRVHDVIQHASPNSLMLPGFEPEVHVNKAETVSEFINRTKGFVKKLSLDRLQRTPHTQFLDVAFNKAAATQYAANKSNRTKRKLTGAFLSQLVENLVSIVDRLKFHKQYGRLIDHHSECTFCNVTFVTFFDACHHIGSQKHKEKTNFLLYHEGLVAMWVRLLSGFSVKRSHEDEIEPIPAKRLSFPVDVINLVE